MISEEAVERIHDDNELQALYAIMNAAASRGKGKKGKLPKVEELYKRPSAEDIQKSEKETIEGIREQQERTKEWLSQFDLSNFNKKDDEEVTEERG